MVVIEMKVLVTGALGFVGKRLVKSLVANNHQVFPTDINTFDVANEKYCRGYFLDTQNAKLIEDVIHRFQPDIVFHLAARVSGPPSVKYPWAYFQTNVNGTYNLVEAMRKTDIKYLVHVSSASVYGSDIHDIVITETTRTKPSNPMGWSKLAGELAVKCYAEEYGIKTTIYRPVVIYGAEQTEKNVIQQIVDSMISHEDFWIYGKGTHTRQPMEVSDIINAMYKGMDYVMNKQKDPWKIFCIAGQEPLSIVEMAEIGRKISPFTIKFKDVKRWAFNQVVDTSYTEKILGWKNKLIFEEGLKKCLNYRLGLN